MGGECIGILGGSNIPYCARPLLRWPLPRPPALPPLPLPLVTLPPDPSFDASMTFRPSAVGPFHPATSGNGQSPVGWSIEWHPAQIHESTTVPPPVMGVEKCVLRATSRHADQWSVLLVGESTYRLTVGFGRLSDPNVGRILTVIVARRLSMGWGLGITGGYAGFWTWNFPSSVRYLAVSEPSRPVLNMVRRKSSRCPSLRTGRPVMLRR